MSTTATVDYGRQLDIFDPANDAQLGITIIGAGGIGSPTILTLAKMGCPKLRVYDADTIEEHNLPNQLYRLDQLGLPKVTALRQNVLDYTGIEIDGRQAMYNGQEPLEGLVISGVDSMAARKTIWQCVKEHPTVYRYIEARMGGLMGTVYVVDPNDPEYYAAYEKTLYSDEEATEEPCTARAVAFNVMALAGIIAAQSRKVLRNTQTDFRVVIDLENFIVITDDKPQTAVPAE